jgi:hypothetical protein
MLGWLAHALNIRAAAHRPKVHLSRFAANQIVSGVFIAARRTQKTDLISPYESASGVRKQKPKAIKLRSSTQALLAIRAKCLADPHNSVNTWLRKRGAYKGPEHLIRT